MNKKILVLGIFVILMFALVPVALADVYSVNIVGHVVTGGTQKTSLAPPTFTATSEMPMTLSLSINSVTPETQNLEFTFYVNGIKTNMYDLGGTIGPDQPLSAGAVIIRDIFFQNGVNPGDNFELEVRNYGPVDVDYDLTVGLSYGSQNSINVYHTPYAEGVITAGQTYTWTAPITGTGFAVNDIDFYWMVTAFAPGTTATLTVNDGHGGTATTAVNFVGLGTYKFLPSGTLNLANGDTVTVGLTVNAGSATVMPYGFLDMANLAEVTTTGIGVVVPGGQVGSPAGAVPFDWKMPEFDYMPGRVVMDCPATVMDACHWTLIVQSDTGEVTCGGTPVPAGATNYEAVTGPCWGDTYGSAGELVSVSVRNDADQNVFIHEAGIKLQESGKTLWATGPVANADLDGYTFVGYTMTAGLDGSGSIGDSLNYAWTCKGGTINLGSSAIVYPEWDVYKNCCAVTPCGMDDEFIVALTVTDAAGDTDSDDMLIQAKEFPFEIGSASFAVTEGSPGVFSGTGSVLNGEALMGDYFVNGPFAKKVITPAISTCSLTNANLIVDPATGDVSISASSGSCKYNVLGVGSLDNIYVNAWIASLIAMAYAAARNTANARPSTADNYGDLSISYSGSTDTLPVTHLAINGALAPINEADLLNQQYLVSDFAFEGRKFGTPLMSAAGINLNVQWKNNEIIIDSGALSSVNKGLPDPDGITHISSADVTINSASINSPSGTASITGFMVMGDYALPSETNCDQTITTTGTTTLSSNIVTSKTAICIQASGVTLDCAGYTITGNGMNTAVYATGSDVTINNCAFSNFEVGIDAKSVDALSITDFTCNGVGTCVKSDNKEGSVIIDGATATEVGMFADIDPGLTDITDVDVTQSIAEMMSGKQTVKIITNGTVNLGNFTITGHTYIKGGSVTGSNVIVSGEGNDKITIADAPDVSLNGVTGTVGAGATGIVITNCGNVVLNHMDLTGGTTAVGRAVSISNSGSVSVSNVNVNNLQEGIIIVASPTVNMNNIVANNILGNAVDLSFASTAAINTITVSNADIGVLFRDKSDGTITGGTFNNVRKAILFDYTTVTINNVDIDTAEVGIEAFAPSASSVVALNDVTMDNVGIGAAITNGIVNFNSVTINALTTGINLARVAGALIQSSTVNNAVTCIKIENSADVLITGGTITGCSGTGLFVNADSSNIRLESIVFSNNTVDINNQDAATGNANTCDSSKVINYKDDGQTSGCDTGVSVDTDGDGVLDAEDDCPTIAGKLEYYGCPYADQTEVQLNIIDLKKSGVCGYDKKGKPKSTCEQNLEGVTVKAFDRENAAFKSAYGKRPNRNLLDNIFEADIGLVSACVTDSDGTCLSGDDHAGKFMVIAKLVDESAGQTVYTAKFKNFKWNRPSWHKLCDDEDVDNGMAPDKIEKTLQIIKTIKKNGQVVYTGGYTTIVEGSLLEIIHPEYTVWDETTELYPFIYESNDTWNVDVCMQVPAGYQIAGVLDENETVVSTTECVQALVAGDPKIFLFKLLETSSPEPEFSFTLAAKHGNKKTTKNVALKGIRKKSEASIEKDVDATVKKLKPEWAGKAKQVLQKAVIKKAEQQKKLANKKPVRKGGITGGVIYEQTTGESLPLSRWNEWWK